MNSDLPRRTIYNFDYWPSSDDIRMASIHRISEEQEISLEEAEVIYGRLLDRIQKALDNIGNNPD